MFKLRYRFILWQASRELKRICNDSMNRGIQEGLFNLRAEDIPKDVYESLERDKKEDREMGEYVNNIYFHNHRSESE
jgi:hypothetical protein